MARSVAEAGRSRRRLGNGSGSPCENQGLPPNAAEIAQDAHRRYHRTEIGQNDLVDQSPFQLFQIVFGGNVVEADGSDDFDDAFRLLLENSLPTRRLNASWVLMVTVPMPLN
jgi:hypothetical protein